MNKKQNEKAVPGMVLWCAVALVGAIASNAIAQEPSAEVAQTSADAAQTSNQVPDKCDRSNQNNVCIDITFDSNGCPTAVDPDGENNPLYIKNSKRVIWQSVDDTPAENPIKEGYEVYFDPFTGQPHKSNGNGRVTALFDPKAPSTPEAGPGIEYKYSIVGDRCLGKPYDPRFKVRR